MRYYKSVTSLDVRKARSEYFPKQRVAWNSVQHTLSSCFGKIYTHWRCFAGVEGCFYWFFDGEAFSL